MQNNFVILYQLWDFRNERGENLIAKWTHQQERQHRARLNVKLDMLVRIPFESAMKSKLLHGPIQKQRHIYKLRIQTNVAMRPLLCRGPIANLTEYTLLLGTEEKGDKLPDGAAEKAEHNRQAVQADPSRRERHVRIA